MHQAADAPGARGVVGPAWSPASPPLQVGATTTTEPPPPAPPPRPARPGRSPRRASEASLRRPGLKRGTWLLRRGWRHSRLAGCARDVGTQPTPCGFLTRERAAAPGGGDGAVGDAGSAAVGNAGGDLLPATAVRAQGTRAVRARTASLPRQGGEDVRGLRAARARRGGGLGAAAAMAAASSMATRSAVARAASENRRRRRRTLRDSPCLAGGAGGGDGGGGDVAAVAADDGAWCWCWCCWCWCWCWCCCWCWCWRGRDDLGGDGEAAARDAPRLSWFATELPVEEDDDVSAVVVATLTLLTVSVS